MEKFDDLRSKNLTDWFIHEARNVLATHNKIEGVVWGKADYLSGREQLARVLESLVRFSEDGLISRKVIQKFVADSTQGRWNSIKVDAIWKQFASLVKPLEPNKK